MKYFNIIVIVRLDRTIQNLMKILDSTIKSGNDEHKKFKCLLARLLKRRFQLCDALFHVLRQRTGKLKIFAVFWVYKP